MSRRLKCEACALPTPGPRCRCSMVSIGAFPRARLRCSLVVPGRVSRRCSRCLSPRLRRRVNALVSCACWARTLPTWTFGRPRSAWAMCFRTPKTRLCARPCGTRWRLAWKTWACRATRCAVAWPRPAISLGWRIGSTAIPTRFRADASSCCRWLPCWRCARACCCSMSPRPSWTPSPRKFLCMRCFV